MHFVNMIWRIYVFLQFWPTDSRPAARAAEAILASCARWARRLGITRVTLRAKIRRYSLA